MQPITIVLLGACLPNTEAGTIAGARAVTAAFLRKFLRVMPLDLCFEDMGYSFLAIFITQTYQKKYI
jgi:hypothetical protein